MYRTGSIGSCVPPAVTTIRRPARSCRRPSNRTAASKSRSIGTSRPMPLIPEASGPVSGPTRCAPRARRVATFAATAGCSHMKWFIAGARTSGALVASAESETISSAMPCANFASISAVAGATTKRSARRPTAICPSSASLHGSYGVVQTRRCVSVAKVSGVTKRVAPSVIRTSTLAPAATQSRANSTTL